MMELTTIILFTVSPSLVETMGDITFEPGLVDGKSVPLYQ